MMRASRISFLPLIMMAYYAAGHLLITPIPQSAIYFIPTIFSRLLALLNNSPSSSLRLTPDTVDIFSVELISFCEQAAYYHAQQQRVFSSIQHFLTLARFQYTASIFHASLPRSQLSSLLFSWG